VLRIVPIVLAREGVQGILKPGDTLVVTATLRSSAEPRRGADRVAEAQANTSYSGYGVH